MVSLSLVKIASILNKQQTELIQKPSDGTSLYNIGIIAIPSQDPFTLSAYIKGPSNNSV